MREDVLVEAGDEVKLGGVQEEPRLLELDGDGHLTRASVNWEMGDLQTEAKTQALAVNQKLSKELFPCVRRLCRGPTRGMALAVRMPKHLVVSSGG